MSCLSKLNYLQNITKLMVELLEIGYVDILEEDIQEFILNSKILEKK